jgi:hypothetical protein
MRVRARQNKRVDLKSVRLSELGPLKVVLPGPQNARRRNIETYFSTNGVTVSQRLELDAMMGMLPFVARQRRGSLKCRSPRPSGRGRYTACEPPDRDIEYDDES